MIKEEVSQLMDLYPRIYFACHTRHVVDPDTKVKLTANQASILDHLDVEDPEGLYDLAMHMGVTPSTMSITINRLVDLGYVQREKDLKDSRKVNLTLTKAGAEIKKKKSVLDADRVEAMLTRLTVQERKIALDGLGLLAVAAEMEMKSKSLSKAWTKRGSSR
ncbi:MarR family transcriptional regulator [Fulvivirgaceae bacterium BMA10]|uniref:MarR family transcriptional regulator n=1 Tax=Splendidivirga corallicola TaxID=3051826 RepID=A0ABT8KTS8_9BACT|nr:MarR family transcriptional regulator [Fulvivirgaceae bacterium BMA10]